ncbi:MAG: dipeptide epimerase, partial [Pseudomonadota bacterium]
MPKLDVTIINRKLHHPFGISGRVRYDTDLLEVTLTEETVSGRGEASGVSYLGETVTTMAAQLNAIREQIEAGADRVALQSLLPAGGARSALDAAFWDLEAKKTSIPVWQGAGLESPPTPLTTAFTISLASLDEMVTQTQREGHRPILKVKLGGKDGLDIDRARLVRTYAPKAIL